MKCELLATLAMSVCLGGWALGQNVPESQNATDSVDRYTQAVHAGLTFAFSANLTAYAVDHEGRVLRAEGTVRQFSLAGKSIALETDQLVAEGVLPAVEKE